MVKAKTKEITMASQNRKKNCIEANRFQSLNKQTSGGGGGGGKKVSTHKRGRNSVLHVIGLESNASS